METNNIESITIENMLKDIFTTTTVKKKKKDIVDFYVGRFGTVGYTTKTASYLAASLKQLNYDAKPFLINRLQIVQADSHLSKSKS